MSSRLSNFVFSIDDKHLKPGPRMVFKTLCWHFNDVEEDKYGLCCPTQETIAKETGYERTRIGEVTSKLEAMGRVVATPMPGFVHRYTYDLFFTVDELVRLGLPEEYVLGRIKELVERESQDTTEVEEHTTDLLKRLEAKRIISPLSSPPDPENRESRLSGLPTMECLRSRQWNVRFVDIRNVGKADIGMSTNATLTVNREQETGEQKAERQTRTETPQLVGRSLSSLSENPVKTPVSEWADKVVDLIECGMKGRRQAREKLLPLQGSDRERIDLALASPSFVFMLKQKKYPAGYLISLLSEGFDETLDKMLEHDSRRPAPQASAATKPPAPSAAPPNPVRPPKSKLNLDDVEEEFEYVVDNKPMVGKERTTQPAMHGSTPPNGITNMLKPLKAVESLSMPVSRCGTCKGTGRDTSWDADLPCLCIELKRTPDFYEHVARGCKLGLVKCPKCGRQMTYTRADGLLCPVCPPDLVPE